MSAGMATMPRNAVFGAGIFGLLMGVALGLLLGAAIALSVTPDRAAENATSGQSVSAPAIDFNEALRQHQLREYGTASAPAIDFKELQRDHLLREYGTASAPAIDFKELQRDHLLRENR